MSETHHTPADSGSFIRQVVLHLLAQAVVNSIVAIALVVVVFALTGGWPPQELLIGSSIGGALSPFGWRAYRSLRGPADPPADDESDEPSVERPEYREPRHTDIA